MSRPAPILAITGLVLLGFGLVEHFMTLTPNASPVSLGWFAILHIVAGLACFGWYALRGNGSMKDFLRMRSTRYGANALVSTLLVVFVVGLLNFLGARYSTRWDVTDSGVYSLSPQTQKVLDSLKDDVEVLAFVSANDEGFMQEVAEIYRYASDRVSFRVIDPQVDPGAAKQELVSTVPTLKIKMGDRSTTVSAIEEEDITNGIHRIARPDRKKIYVLEGHGEPDANDRNDPAGSGRMMQALRDQNYVVEMLFLTEEGSVPEDADMVLAATGRRPYFPAEIDMLRAYIRGGGAALFFVDVEKGAELKPLLSSVGINLGDNVVLDQQVRMFEGVTLGMDAVVTHYGVHPAVAGFDSRTIFSIARSVAPEPTIPEGLRVESIARSSDSSWGEIDLERVFSKGEAAKQADDLAGPVSLGTASSGPVSAIGGEGDTEFRVAAFGDTAVLTNRYIQQLFNDELVGSVTGWLTGEEERIAIGPRGVRASRAHLGETEARTVFYLSVLVLPELILLLGIAVWWRRSSL